MSARIPFTASELMALREEGMSNHDIAAKLDITEQTVRNYIGPQHKQLSRLAAFADSEPHRTEECPPLEPAYSPTVMREDFEIADGVEGSIVIYPQSLFISLKTPTGTATLTPDQAATVMQFLAWASKHIEGR